MTSSVPAPARERIPTPWEPSFPLSSLCEPPFFSCRAPPNAPRRSGPPGRLPVRRGISAEVSAEKRRQVNLGSHSRPVTCVEWTPSWAFLFRDCLHVVGYVNQCLYDRLCPLYNISNATGDIRPFDIHHTGGGDLQRSGSSEHAGSTLCEGQE